MWGPEPNPSTAYGSSEQSGGRRYSQETRQLRLGRSPRGIAGECQLACESGRETFYLIESKVGPMPGRKEDAAMCAVSRGPCSVPARDIVPRLSRAAVDAGNLVVGATVRHGDFVVSVETKDEEVEHFPVIVEVPKLEAKGIAPAAGCVGGDATFGADGGEEGLGHGGVVSNEVQALACFLKFGLKGGRFVSYIMTTPQASKQEPSHPKAFHHHLPRKPRTHVSQNPKRVLDASKCTSHESYGQKLSLFTLDFQLNASHEPVQIAIWNENAV